MYEFMAQRDNQCRVKKKKTQNQTQTLLYVGGGAEDTEPLQSHSDGAQVAVHPLQTFLQSCLRRTRPAQVNTAPTAARVGRISDGERRLTSSILACALTLPPVRGSWLRAASICVADGNQWVIPDGQRRRTVLRG